MYQRMFFIFLFVYVIQNNLSGDWNTRMRCPATTCMGSAIGDEKNEKWNISLENDGITMLLKGKIFGGQ